MNYRRLGRTGLRVSAIAAGTVELGMSYGIGAGGDREAPGEHEAIRLLLEAADAGINFFDTAPAYGASERIVGRALGARSECAVATKVNIPKDASGVAVSGRELRRTVESSLETSLRLLQRETLDVVQIHNATVEVIRRGELMGLLQEARNKGSLRFTGASVYTADEAAAAIEAGTYDVLQVPFSLLDQRMAARVFGLTMAKDVAVVARSVLLKGVLTNRSVLLPAKLDPLKEAAARACAALSTNWDDMPSVAVQFALSAGEVSSVLVGLRSGPELRQALEAEKQGPLSHELLRKAAAMGLTDDRLLNPSRWPVL